MIEQFEQLIVNSPFYNLGHFGGALVMLLFAWGIMKIKEALK